MARTQRFTPSMHLVRKRDFSRVYRDGSRARGELFTVVLAPNELDVTRLGLSVGRVVSKLAVRRNRLRRLVREAFRLNYAALPAGVDVVVVGATAGLDAPLAAVSRDLVRLCSKAAERRRGRARRAPKGEAS